MPDVAPAELHAIVHRICRALGSEDSEAVLVADQLVGANLAGHDSHGVGMMPAYVEHARAGELHVNEHAEVLNDTGPLVTLDGRAGFGQVMGFEAMNIAIERARDHGVALVGLRNSFHIGRIGHWAEQCSAAGLVSIHLVNVAGHGPAVAPFGSASARLGTNPVCIGVPGRNGKPAALLDMATSTIALGKARVALNRGETVPAGTIVDADGNLSDDPSHVIGVGGVGAERRGALVAFGEHKGSGLAIMAELVGAALLGGLTMREQNGPSRIYNSMITICIDPAATGSAEALLAETEASLAWFRTGTVRNGVEEILMPGEPEQRSRVARADSIPVDDVTMEQLLAAEAAAS